MFYLRLARQNLRSDRRIFMPFWLAETVLMALNITLLNAALESSTLLGQYSDGSYGMLFVFAAIIVMILSVLLSWYANNFLLKQRTRQLAVYNLIGFGRGELGVMLITELAVLTVGAIVVGAVAGFVLGRLGVLLLARIFSVSIKGLGLAFNPLAILLATLVIGAIMLSLMVIDLVWLKRHQPAQLRAAAKAGEVQPKTRWLLFLVGIVTTIAGYYFALKKHSADSATIELFIAIILVIVGTYALFIAGSVFVLKLLRRSPRFYYQPKHFVSISNLLYRMKQNGAGLASITILLTMTLLTLGTIATFFVGARETARKNTPQDLIVRSYLDEDPAPKTLPLVEKAAKEVGVEAKVLHTAKIYQVPISLIFENGGFVEAGSGETDDDSHVVMTQAISLETYRQLTGQNRKLAGRESILIAYPGFKVQQKSLRINKLSLDIKYRDTQSPLLDEGMESNEIILVLNDATIRELQAQFSEGLANHGQPPIPATWSIEYGLRGSDEQQLALFNKISPELKEANIYPGAYVDTWAHLMQVYGSLMVVGGIIGLAFILATALILYDKQVSEGLADASRFVTLQRVGLSKRETRQTISRQLRVVFILPPVVAALHILGISPFLLEFFKTGNLATVETYFYATTATYLIILIVYLALYWLTKRVYYTIVSRASMR